MTALVQPQEPPQHQWELVRLQAQGLLVRAQQQAQPFQQPAK
jgi:hypothetical protein